MTTNLLGLSLSELRTIVTELGEKPFRAGQLWHWLYEAGIQSFDEMSNLSKSFRETLAAGYTLARPEVRKDYISIDGTRKWLVALADGQEVEVVFIPEEERGTLCVSSQVGCTLTCTFCHTGTQKLVRNLTAGEIAGQFLLARDALNDWPSSKEGRTITNIVMMGMGEPLFNYDNVAQALKVIMDKNGINFSRQRITLSTSGVVPKIEECATELGVNLAISLHAVRDELRDEIVPLNRKYPLSELLAACRQYVKLCNTRRITFEYVMLNGVNDSDADARELIRLIRGLPAKVNLIPFNPWPGTRYTCSSAERIAAFSDIIKEAGYAAPVRTPRGQDILAACGQLRSESMREKRAAA